MGGAFGGGLRGLPGLRFVDFHELLLILEWLPDLSPDLSGAFPDVLKDFAAPSRNLTFRERRLLGRLGRHVWRRLGRLARRWLVGWLVSW